MDWTDHPGPIVIAFSDDDDKTSRTEHDVKAAHYELAILLPTLTTIRAAILMAAGQPGS